MYIKSTLLILLSLFVSSVCFGDEDFVPIPYDESAPKSREIDFDATEKMWSELNPDVDYDFGDSQKLEWESDDAKSSYQFKQYASIGFVCVVIVVVSGMEGTGYLSCLVGPPG